MKKYLLVLLAIALFTTAAFAQQKTGTTTISLTVGPEAWISVPSSTPLLNAGSDFTVDYVGTTAIAYKVRTTTSGSITFKAAEFDVTGGPKIASPVAGDELKATQPKLPFDSDAEKWADQLMTDGGDAPAVLINPGAGWGAKRWPVERYADVARGLLNRGCRVFVNAGPGFVWRSYSGSGSLPHTIIICGYDDLKHAYKVMNSWGTSWGDAGFSWIDYDFFLQKSSYNTYAIQ